MTSKFNPKKHLGKDKIFVAVPFSPRISRIWIWDAKRGEYRTADKQKPYVTRRWETDQNGSRKRTYQCFDTLDEARVWQGEVNLAEQSLAPGAVQRPRGGKTLSDIIAEWKKRRFAALEEGTQVRYQNIIDLYFGSLLNLSIYDITSQRLDIWLDDLKDPNSWTMKSKKRKMFDHELSLLSTILKYYVDYHDDPNYQFPIKKRHKAAVWLKRGTRGTDKQLPEDQFLRFREELEKLESGKLLAILATVQYYQALRISEVAALSWEDVLFDWSNPYRSRLKIRKKIYWPRRKGIVSVVKEGFKNADSGDNQGVKEQPLFPESYEALLSLHFPSAKSLVFLKSGTHLRYRLLQNRYDKAFRLAGLPHTGTHIMRHGGCSRLFDERGDLGVAKQILGNSSLRSVEVYARRSKTALTEVAAKHWERKSLRLVTTGN